MSRVISKPEHTTQNRVVKLFTDTLETKLTKALKIKQGMMQNMLTGRIRLIGTGALAPDIADKNRARLKPHL
ncbi:MAG: hypothetical protein ABFS45_02945 [Pseudomonadota bacterium]